ncbi:MAG: hypothetical protein LC780_16985, partial [Acidobacteria bacterium]|nr:hypothetical protein [Acidobacteriota bacterium]
MRHRFRRSRLDFDLRSRGPRRGDAPPEDRAAAQVARLGGTVERDENAPGRPISGVDLHGTKVADGNLEALSVLKGLRALDLRLTSV